MHELHSKFSKGSKFLVQGLLIVSHIMHILFKSIQPSFSLILTMLVTPHLPPAISNLPHSGCDILNHALVWRQVTFHGIKNVGWDGDILEPGWITFIFPFIIGFILVSMDFELTSFFGGVLKLSILSLFLDLLEILFLYLVLISESIRIISFPIEGDFLIALFKAGLGPRSVEA